MIYIIVDGGVIKSVSTDVNSHRYATVIDIDRDAEKPDSVVFQDGFEMNGDVYLKPVIESDIENVRLAK